MTHDKQFSTTLPGVGRVYVDSYGSGGYTINVRGEDFLFDWSDQFGPLPLRKDGKERMLGPNHKFWRAASLWSLQGKRLEGKRAIWHEPKQPVLKREGNQITYAEDGEPGWDW